MDSSPNPQGLLDIASLRILLPNSRSKLMTAAPKSIINYGGVKEKSAKKAR